MKRSKEELWNNIWKDISSKEEDVFILEKEENSVRWQRIKKLIMNKFENLSDLEVIELGAGIGTYSALMAKRKANVTVLDFSENAIERSRRFFQNNGLSVQHIKQDALKLPKHLLNKYDISMSFGLAEHFIGLERTRIIKLHFDVLKRGGMSFISVPNILNLPYRFFKFFTQQIGRWQVGEEYPYSRNELRAICNQIGITEYSFLGDSLISSFAFINPFTNRTNIPENLDDKKSSRIRKEKGTFLDSYFSYALVLCGTK
ncbi:MAG: class I SAM-dependent methyltransferase [Candidatus Thorarchaeota archaeon]